jgi:TRAP-type C4-dicarboxylate transport system permease small subunit
MIERLIRFNDMLARGLVAVAALAIAATILALAATAAERHLVGTGLTLLNDLPPLLMPWIVFPLMGVLLRLDRHITVDFLPPRLSARRRQLLSVFVSLVTLAASLVMLAGSARATAFIAALGQSTETAPYFPMWWIHASVPAGFALLAWFALERLLTSVLALSARRPGREGAES